MYFWSFLKQTIPGYIKLQWLYSNPMNLNLRDAWLQSINDGPTTEPGNRLVTHTNPTTQQVGKSEQRLAV